MMKRVEDLHSSDLGKRIHISGENSEIIGILKKFEFDQLSAVTGKLYCYLFIVGDGWTTYLTPDPDSNISIFSD